MKNLLTKLIDVSAGILIILGTGVVVMISVSLFLDEFFPPVVGDSGITWEQSYPVTFTKADKLDFLYSLVPLKERCRWEEENGLIRWTIYRVKSDTTTIEDKVLSSTGEDCAAYLEKTKSEYKIK